MADERHLDRNATGGSATAGGVRYQSSVTAIVEAHLARGVPLQWLSGLVSDVPIAVAAETAGPGDDIRVELDNGKAVEAQVKRGLRADARLWDALLNLAHGLQNAETDYGVLIVSPDSSATIRNDLASDIVRIGEGRTDALHEPGQTFLSKLKDARLQFGTICQRLRIITIHALDGDNASIQIAQTHLAQLCRNKGQVGEAWGALSRDALEIMEHRGRRDASSVLRVLAAAGIKLSSSSETPIAFLSQLCDWVSRANSEFSVFGIEKPLPLKTAWIPLSLFVQNPDAKRPSGLQEALAQYHDWHKRDFGGGKNLITPSSLTRFFPLCVVVAGPGMGKSTYVKKLAYDFAIEQKPVLKVSLPMMSARMRQGFSFEETLFALGLDGSGFTSHEAITSKIHNWLLLCDGLDECGPFQETVVEGLIAFLASRPSVRVLVTTRPVGYSTALLRSWRHYEVLPLEKDKYTDHLKQLLTGVLPHQAVRAAEIVAFAAAEVKKSKSSEVVTRSPLLLGLSLALALQGTPFGRNKSQLYEKLFSIIDHIPNVRRPSNGPTTAVLMRFLDVLGWDMIFHPVSSTAEMMARCAIVFANDLGGSRLQAAQLCDQCSSYWQNVGMLERVQHAGDETLSFVHKTFGEFAAARYLVALAPEQLATQVSALFNREAANEVIGFAGSLGAAKPICTELLKHTANSDDAIRNVPRALALIVEEKNPPPPEQRSQALAFAAELLTSPDREVSEEVGISLIPIAEKYPDDTVSVLQPLARHKQGWTRLAAWAALLACGEKYYELDALLEAFQLIPREIKTGTSTSLGGGLVLARFGFQLTQIFTLSAMRAILTRLDRDKADTLIRETFKNERLQSWDTIQKAHAVLRSFGREYSLASVPEDYVQRWTDMKIDPEGYLKMNRVAFTRMFRPLAGGSEVNLPADAPLYQVSALMAITRVWDMAASDIWGWKDEDLVKEEELVIRTMSIASGLDLNDVANDVDAYLHRLENFIEGPEGRTGVYEGTIFVDAPALDWSRIKGRDIDRDAIERAIYHKSDWLMQLAANILSEIVPKDELPTVIRRILTIGRGTALWAAAALAETLDPIVRCQLILERLEQPLCRGCEYLVSAIDEGNPELNADIQRMLEKVLLGTEAGAAVAAGKLALSLAQGTTMQSLLVRSYAHWQKHEEPYPVGGGVIPPSPRSELVKAMRKIGEFSDEQIFQMCSDPRSDVRDAISDVALDRLSSSADFAKEFIERVSASLAPARLLIDALRAKKAFTADAISAILALLDNPDPKLRFSALGILDVAYLDETRIQTKARQLQDDSEAEIRERVGQVLHRLRP